MSWQSCVPNGILPLVFFSSVCFLFQWRRRRRRRTKPIATSGGEKQNIPKDLLQCWCVLLWPHPFTWQTKAISVWLVKPATPPIDQPQYSVSKQTTRCVCVWDHHTSASTFYTVTSSSTLLLCGVCECVIIQENQTWCVFSYRPCAARCPWDGTHTHTDHFTSL